MPGLCTFVNHEFVGVLSHLQVDYFVSWSSRVLELVLRTLVTRGFHFAHSRCQLISQETVLKS